MASESYYKNLVVDPEGDDRLFNTTQSDLINIIAPTSTGITNQQIADYISTILGGAGTDAEKAAAINAAAQQYKVSREQIAGATGWQILTGSHGLRAC